MKTIHLFLSTPTICKFSGLRYFLSFFVIAFFAASPMAANDTESNATKEKEAALAYWKLYSILNNNAELAPTLLQEKEPRFEIVFFPLSFFVSGIEVGIEFPVRERQHLRLSAGYFYSYNAGAYNNFGAMSDNFYNYSYNEMEGFRTEAQYRFYWHNERSYENFYVSPFAVFKSVSLEAERRGGGSMSSETVKLNSSAASFGFLFGLRAIMFEKMSFDINLGGGITPTNIGDYELVHIEQINPYRRSIHFKGGLTMGLLIY